MTASRPTLVWLILVMATIGAWTLGNEDGGVAATSIVLLIAFAKTWLVGMEFMDLRRATRFAKVFLLVWVAGVSLSLIGIYAMAPNHLIMDHDDTVGRGT